MSRVLPLIVFVALVVGLFMLPMPDPTRLAAIQVGTLLRQPTQLPADVDWRAALAPGDRVELEDGEEREVRSMTAESLTITSRTGAVERTVRPDEIARVIEKRPLWRYLTEGSASHPIEDEGNDATEVWVRGYRMNLMGSLSPDQRLHARVFESVKRSLLSISAEEGFEIRFRDRPRQDFPGATLVANRGVGRLDLEVQLPDGTVVGASRMWAPASNRSLLPPLVAILLAMLFRRPLLALGAGVLVGAVFERGMYGVGLAEAMSTGGARLFTHTFPEAILEPTRIQILLFIACMLSMVGVMARAGGVRGLMESLARLANSARRSQIATFAMGLAVFFDHYANSILVGTTMRPLTDRFRVAREKLAYIVDSTAAPVAGLSIFSTWIAFEVSTFSVQLPEAGMAASQGYEVFLRTLPYRFYSLFTLFLVGCIALSGRDFGPMLRAERRARRGQLLAKGARLLSGATGRELSMAPGVTPRMRTAVLPLAVFVLVTMGAILVRGGAFENPSALLTSAGLADVVFQGSGSWTLLIGAACGLFTALGTALSAGLGRGVGLAAWSGLRSMGSALGLLLLAWMIGSICNDLGTATYLSVLINETLNPLFLPILLFGIAGLISFSTGSSWSTMTILLPLVVGVAFEAGVSTPIGGEGMLIVAIGAVLEGAIFGDHCSPISDTTVMSSLASGSDHVDHVRTQAPYAALAMVVAVVCGYFPVVIVGLSPYFSLLLGAGVLILFLRIYGEQVGEAQLDEALREERVEAPLSRAA